MKHTRQQIIDMSNRSHSHADALATLYQMIREEFEQERKISRRKIRASVEMTFQDYEMYPYEVYTAIAESVFAAAGWTIVDDDREMQGITQPQTGEQAKRLRTLHQARELLDSLINETAKKEPDNVKGWQPIETAPEDQWVWVADHDTIAGTKAKKTENGWVYATGIRVFLDLKYWMPIPPLPEIDK